MLEVDAEGAPAAPYGHVREHVRVLGGVRAIDADDVRPEIGEQHDAVRSRTESGELDDADTGERSCAARRTLRTDHRRPPCRRPVTSPWG